MEPNQYPSAPPTGGRTRYILDKLRVVAIYIATPLVALLVVHFAFQTYQVDGPSMEKTLQHKDLMIILKAEKTLASILPGDYVPNRYDVIIFDHEVNNVPTGDQFVKRVIALPGERVVIKDNKVTVYTTERPQGFEVDKENPETEKTGVTPGETDVVVPNGKLFVLGDNRENSLDSRYIGPIDQYTVVGKLLVRVYPLNKLTLF